MLRIFKHYINIPAIILSGGESFYLFFQSLIIYHIIQKLNFKITPNFSIAFASFIAIFTITSMACAGLYNRQHFVRYGDVISRTMVIVPTVLIITTITLLFHDHITNLDIPTGNYLFCFVTLTAFSLALLAWRAAFIEMIDRVDTFKRRVLILGSGNRAANIENLSRKHRDRTITIIGYVRLGVPPVRAESPTGGRRTAARRADYWVTSAGLADFCREKNVEEVVVASTERRGLPVGDLLSCKLQGIKITEYASFWERESGQIDPDEINPGWMLFSDGFNLGILHRIVKRTFDILVSSLLLILTLPITLPTALLIRFESKGPIFYRQERVGLHGKSFMVLKFRSMRTDAEKDGPRWAAKNDSRVTKVGSFIRKVRIDEIPQVINVLKGDMAFVGPRPERPVFVKTLAEKIPYYNERHVAKPGITGWAQINYPYGATEHDAKMKLSYDLYCIKNGSLFLDIIIIMQTVKAVVWNSGAR